MGRYGRTIVFLSFEISLSTMRCNMEKKKTTYDLRGYKHLAYIRW